MATIAALLDVEEGHFLKTFRLAKELEACGHKVCYLGLAGAEAMVRQQGFELVPIFEGLLPGAIRAGEARDVDSWYGSLIRGQALDGVMNDIKPDAILMLSLYYPEALVVHFRYRLPIVLLTSCRPSDTPRAEMIEGLVANRFIELKSADMEAALQVIAASGFRFRSFKELAEVVVRMPELVMLPRAIELPELADDPHVFYTGTGVDPERREEPFPWADIDPDRCLVYGSLGSQSELKPEITQRFIEAVLGAARARPDRQFIVSVGKGLDPAAFAPVPSNAHLSRWVPQLAVLRRADIMLTHCGRGTVMECVRMGVPMVALPLMRDQFEMSLRVIHHRLGVQGSLPDVTAEKLNLLIDEVVADTALKGRIAAMRERFLEEDKSDLGIRVIEAALAGGC